MPSKQSPQRPSLETLLEGGNLIGLPTLHPGGLGITRELAELCRAGPGKSLLDVASGTGESACYLAESFDCRVCGVDRSAFMVETSNQKATGRKLQILFHQADAHHLPFEAGTFDAVISECTICALDRTTLTISPIACIPHFGPCKDHIEGLSVRRPKSMAPPKGLLLCLT